MEKCNYYMRKDGSMIYIPLDTYSPYRCLLKQQTYIECVLFPLLHGKKEDDIVEKLLLLHMLQQKKFYMLSNDLFSNTPENIYFYFFPKKYSKNAIIIKYLMNYMYLHPADNTLSISYSILHIMHPTISNEEISIQLFYQYYIESIRKEIETKYQRPYSSFANYHQLYLFLHQKKYVHFFYQKKMPVILQESPIILLSLLKTPEFKKFQQENKKKIQSFQTIDLLYLIDKQLSSKYNKTYIKNRFIQIIQKI